MKNNSPKKQTSDYKKKCQDLIEAILKMPTNSELNNSLSDSLMEKQAINTTLKDFTDRTTKPMKDLDPETLKFFQESLDLSMFNNLTTNQPTLKYVLSRCNQILENTTKFENTEISQVINRVIKDYFERAKEPEKNKGDLEEENFRNFKYFIKGFKNKKLTNYFDESFGKEATTFSERIYSSQAENKEVCNINKIMLQISSESESKNTESDYESDLDEEECNISQKMYNLINPSAKTMQGIVSEERSEENIDKIKDENKAGKINCLEVNKTRYNKIYSLKELLGYSANRPKKSQSLCFSRIDKTNNIQIDRSNTENDKPKTSLIGAKTQPLSPNRILNASI